jgi:filamentous hemagglutinin family protein
MFDRWQKLLLATTALVPLGLAPAAANPLGAQVVGGSATVQGQGTASVTVKQTTDKAIINWNSFNIGAKEKTQFVQPSSSSVALNRVTGGLGPSQIYGSLSANGRIFVVNPDGILIGPGAKIDTAGFLATTHDIANADFMAGRYNFTIPGRPDASVVNQGTITAQTSGFAALVAPGVRNSGTITARLGNIDLAAANAFSLDFYGDKLITLGVNDTVAAGVKDVATGQTLKSLLHNEGKLKADGGTVELTAVAAREVVDSVINNTGVIEANSIGTKNGMIVLGAATAATKPAGAPIQTVKVSGTLSAAGKNAGENGGKVQITGEDIQVTDAKIDASGAAGGGKVLIGGDWSGGHPTAQIANASAALESYAVPTATSVLFDPSSLVDVSATITGNGGKAIVWADQSTNFGGTILGRGGAVSGDGGFVEVSGHQALTFNGKVDTHAVDGSSGTLLLDPTDIRITGGPVFCGGTCPSDIDVITTLFTLNSALANNNVTIQTSTSGSRPGDISVETNIIWSSNNSLTLSANHDITINHTIANTGAGNLNLRADSQGTGVGTVNFLGAGKIDFSQSTGNVGLFYNPSFGFAFPIDYAPYFVANPNISNQFAAYMLVNNVNDLQNIQQNLAGTYALGKDIDASVTLIWNGGAGFSPIYQFRGTFDGQDHKIDSLYINESVFQRSDIGLFGYNEGTIRNVGLTNVSINVDAGYETYVGALVGLNAGIIIGASTDGVVAVTAASLASVGGLVGRNDGTISGSSSNAHVAVHYPNDAAICYLGGSPGLCDRYTGGLIGWNVQPSGYNFPGTISQSHASGVVETDGSAGADGGLVGSNKGAIFQSYSTANVHSHALETGGLVGVNSAGSINQSYSAGSVTQNDSFSPFGEIGGLVGANSGTISQSFSTTSITNAASWPAYIGGIVGDNISGSVMESYGAGPILIGSTTYNGGTLYAYGGITAYNGAITTNNYWDVNSTTITNDVRFGNPAGTPRTTSQLKSGLPSGFDTTVWGSNSAINNGYPYLLWQTANAPVSPPPSPPPPPVSYVESGVGTILSPSQIAGVTFPAETFFVQSGTGTQFTPEQLGGFTAAPPAGSPPSPPPVSPPPNQTATVPSSISTNGQVANLTQPPASSTNNPTPLITDAAIKLIPTGSQSPTSAPAAATGSIPGEKKPPPHNGSNSSTGQQQATGSNLSFPGPNEILTWPAVEGLIETGLAPLIKLMPPDIASSFQKDLSSGIQNVLADGKLTISTGGLTVVGFFLNTLVSDYIDRLAGRAMSNCGGGVFTCAVPIGLARYELQVVATAGIDYATTPALWTKGWAGAGAAGGAAIIQSTTGTFIDLFRSWLGV